MATSKKSSFYLLLATGAEAELQLDADIYSSAVTLELGLTATKTAATKSIKLPVKTVGSSPFAQLLKVSLAKGTNPETATEYRAAKLICKADKVDTALSNLVGKTVKLGYGTQAVDWVITGVR